MPLLNPRNLLYLVRASLRRGPRFAITYFMESVAFDLAYGTNTHLRVPKPDQKETPGGDRKDGLLYVASLTSVVREALACCRKTGGEALFSEAQFIDLGCGKGKALLVYAKESATARSPTAVGIEYDEALCHIARSNVMRMGTTASSVEIHCDSAVNVASYLNAPVAIIYLYNSFQGQTLRKVLGMLADHPHWLIYVDPAEERALPLYGYETQRHHKGRYHADTWLVATNPKLRALLES